MSGGVPRLEAGVAVGKSVNSYHAALTALRAALIEGEQSGLSTPFDFDAFLARKRAALPADE
jgi:Arc/MetJ-type ribon-helix-helix transcriptional regulator